MKNPSLSQEELAALRQVLRHIIAHHNENLREAAKAIGWSKSALSDVVNGTSGAGMALLKKLSDHLDRPIEDIIGRRPYDAPTIATLRSLITVPGFVEARAAIEASAEHGGRPMPADVLDAAGRTAFNPPPARITPEFLRFVCEAIIQARADDWQSRTIAAPEPAANTETARKPGRKSKAPV
jgi:transcriptional regulator with XRE-family HTH domain